MAIYNNGLPMTYAQPNMPSYPTNMQPPQFSPTGQGDILWVQGKEAAKAYPVCRNGCVTLFDSEGDFFYIKSTDVSGMPQKLRVFKYEEIFEDTEDSEQVVEQSIQDDYVTHDDLDNINQTISELSQQIGILIQAQNNLIQSQNEVGVIEIPSESEKEVKTTAKKTTTRKVVNK